MSKVRVEQGSGGKGAGERAPSTISPVRAVPCGLWTTEQWQAVERLFEKAGFKFHTGQIEFLKRRYARKFLNCGRRWGKSRLLAAEIITHIMEMVGMGIAPRVRLVAPRHDQIREVLRYLQQYVEALGLRYVDRHMDMSDPRVLIENYRVDLRIAGKQTAHRGGYATLLCVDEARDIDAQIFFEAMRPLMLDFSGRVVIASTSKGRAWFVQYAEEIGLEPFKGIFDETMLEPYYSEIPITPGDPDSRGALWVQAPSWTNPFLPREELEAIRKEMSTERKNEDGSVETVISPIYLSEIGACILEDYGHPFPVQPIFATVKPEHRRYTRVAIGLDYGTAAAFAAIWVYKSTDGNFYVDNEIYETALSPQDQVDKLMKRGVPPGAMLVADKSLWNEDGRTPVYVIWRDYAKRRYQADWARRIIPATGEAVFERKSHVQKSRGIRQHMLDLLRTVFAEGRVIIDAHRCPNLCSEIMNARMRPNVYLDVEKPDHAIMALAYAIDYLYNLPMPKFRSIHEPFTLDELIEYQDQLARERYPKVDDEEWSIVSLGIGDDADTELRRAREDFLSQYEWYDEHD